MYAKKSDPPAPRKRKKLVFTIEYLESKLNRKLEEEEAGRLSEYIQKGQNTKIFEMLVIYSSIFCMGGQEKIF